MPPLADNEKRFYLVKGDLLPEVFVKTLKAKELLRKGEVRTIRDAVQRVGLSRSAFYKYKDSVFPFFEVTRGKIITLSLLLEHRPGVLSRVLNTVAMARGNVLTINQGIPLEGVANVSISFETAGMRWNAEEVLERLRVVPGVKKVDIVAQD